MIRKGALYNSFEPRDECCHRALLGDEQLEITREYTSRGAQVVSTVSISLSHQPSDTAFLISIIRGNVDCRTFK